MEEDYTEFHAIVCVKPFDVVKYGGVVPFVRYITNSTVPRWFAVTMGTGIVSILLHNLPYNGIWLYWISVVIFALNVFLFNVFLIISILRYTFYPQIWFVMICHPTQSLFLGTFPMGLATIINMVVFVCVPTWGTWAVYLVKPPSLLLCKVFN